MMRQRCNGKTLHSFAIHDSTNVCVPNQTNMGCNTKGMQMPARMCTPPPPPPPPPPRSHPPPPPRPPTTTLLLLSLCCSAPRFYILLLVLMVVWWKLHLL